MEMRLVPYRHWKVRKMWQVWKNTLKLFSKNITLKKAVFRNFLYSPVFDFSQSQSWKSLPKNKFPYFNFRLNPVNCLHIVTKDWQTDQFLIHGHRGPLRCTSDEISSMFTKNITFLTLGCRKESKKKSIGKCYTN